MSDKLTAIILAAGRGTRLRSSLPKVLHPVGGIPLLAHVIQTARAVADQIVIVYGHEGDTVQAALKETAADCQWVKQAAPLGTGDALKTACDALPAEADGRLLILSGDVPLLRVETAEQLLAQTPAAGVGLLTAMMDDPACLGRIVRDEKGQVQAIVEYKDATAREREIREINAGVYVLPLMPTREWVKQLQPNNQQQEYYLTDLVPCAREAGHALVAVNLSDARDVFGVNDRLQLAQAERYYQQRQVERLSACGVSFRDPARFDQRGSLTVGQDTVFDVNVICEGTVRIGERCHIGASVILKDVDIGDDVVIKPMSVLEGARIGAGCDIGPFARIRPGTTLAPAAKVGNFVEIKNSDIGTGSKINHLSYVGDASLGQRVNMGAGSITCNYDGINKHRTIIGDQVFVGSNTVLVSPLNIGAHAFIAAGSSITEDTPAGGLSIGRSRQKHIANWQPPQKKKETE